MLSNYICRARQQKKNITVSKKEQRFSEQKHVFQIILGGDQINCDTLELLRRGQEEVANWG